MGPYQCNRWPFVSGFFYLLNCFSSHIPVAISISILVFCWWIILHCMDISHLLVHSSVDEYLGCLYFGAIMTNDMNIHEWILCGHVLFLCHMIIPALNDELPNFSTMAISFISPPAMYEDCSFSISPHCKSTILQ